MGIDMAGNLPPACVDIASGMPRVLRHRQQARGGVRRGMLENMGILARTRRRSPSKWGGTPMRCPKARVPLYLSGSHRETPLLYRHKLALRLTGIDLPGAGDLLLGITQHLLPLG